MPATCYGNTFGTPALAAKLGLVLFAAALVGCKGGDASYTAADTGIVMFDTTGAMSPAPGAMPSEMPTPDSMVISDTVSAADTLGGSIDSATVASVPPGLPPATLQVQGLKGMRKKKASPVTITLKRIDGDVDSAMDAARSAVENTPEGGVVMRTRVGGVATVCLKGHPMDFVITGGDSSVTDGSCSRRDVVGSEPSPFVFYVVPQDWGTYSLQVQVRGANQGRVMIDSTYAVNVSVGSWWDEMMQIINSATLLTKATTGLLVALAAAWVAWRTLRKPA
jgi:hypothetical protein